MKFVKEFEPMPCKEWLEKLKILKRDKL